MNPANNINPLFSAALEFQNYFQKQNWAFCFIGGLAVLRWGEMRMTQDIDLCLLCSFGAEDFYVSKLVDFFRPRIANAGKFARQNRVLLLQASNGVAIDISLSGLPFEEEMITRASFFEYHPGYSLLTCSAEDLIVLKAFADRPKDWLDIEGILAHQGENLDLSFITQQLTPLCELKESPEIIHKLARLVQG